MHHLFVMSVDALFTENLADARHLPGFSEILPRAAVYENVRCVYPTLTYVCHASIMSGCWPDRHGVPHNQKLDPATDDRDWYWDYASLRVPTVFDWAKRAGLTHVPAYIRTANEAELTEMALIENIQREDLNAIEIALTFKKLLDQYNLTQEKLSERIGK